MSVLNVSNAKSRNHGHYQNAEWANASGLKPDHFVMTP